MNTVKVPENSLPSQARAMLYYRAQVGIHSTEAALFNGLTYLKPTIVVAHSCQVVCLFSKCIYLLVVVVHSYTHIQQAQCTMIWGFYVPMRFDAGRELAGRRRFIPMKFGDRPCLHTGHQMLCGQHIDAESILKLHFYLTNVLVHFYLFFKLRIIIQGWCSESGMEINT